MNDVAEEVSSYWHAEYLQRVASLSERTVSEVSARMAAEINAEIDAEFLRMMRGIDTRPDFEFTIRIAAMVNWPNAARRRPVSEKQDKVSWKKEGF